MDQKQRDRSNLIMRFILLGTVLVLTGFYTQDFIHATNWIEKIGDIGMLTFFWYQIYSIFKHKCTWY